MARYDWNRDGKNDIRDDFIEYNMYKQSSEAQNTNNHRKKFFNNGGGLSDFGTVCAAIISILVLGGILSIFNVKLALYAVASVIVVSVVGAIITVFF